MKDWIQYFLLLLVVSFFTCYLHYCIHVFFHLLSLNTAHINIDIRKKFYSFHSDDSFWSLIHFWKPYKILRRNSLSSSGAVTNGISLACRCIRESQRNTRDNIYYCNNSKCCFDCNLWKLLHQANTQFNETVYNTPIKTLNFMQYLMFTLTYSAI